MVFKSEETKTQKWELDASSTLDRIYELLTGKYYSRKDREWKQSKTIQRVLPMTVVYDIMRKAKTYLNPNNVFSNTNTNISKRITLEAYADLLMKLYHQDLRHVEETYKKSIANEISNFIYLGIRRSKGALSIKAWRDMEKRQTNITRTETPEKPGIMDQIMGRNKDNYEEDYYE